MLVEGTPRAEGTVERDGVRIAYQVFGSGPTAILLLPTWSIVHSDFWRGQVPHFADRYTVIAFDGRGSGKSDRPAEVAAYAEDLFAGDAIAVLDEVGVDRAAIVAASQGAAWGTILAARHPSRVQAAVFIGPSIPLAPPFAERAAAFAVFDAPQARYDGWLKFNRHYWLANWPDFLWFFFGRCFTEPNSEPFIRHFVEMGLQTTPAVVAATVDAPGLDAPAARELAAAIECPVLVIHGDADAIAPVARGAELARLSGGELHVLPGSGHEPQSRDPLRTNALIGAFLDRYHPAAGGRASGG